MDDADNPHLIYGFINDDSIFIRELSFYGNKIEKIMDNILFVIPARSEVKE